MDPIPTPEAALNQLIEALSPKKRESLAPAIRALTLIVAPRLTSPQGSFWQDPERAARARAAVKATWAARAPLIQLSWRTSGVVETYKGFSELSKRLNRSENSIRVLLSKGKGVAHVYDDDDIITIQRL